MATALIYGAPGSGKTINTTRIPGKTLLLSSDNSARVLNNFERPNLTVKEAMTFKDFVDDFEAATASKQYDNIIVDCLTDLIDAYITEIREKGFSGDIRQHYLAIYTKVKFLVRKAAFCDTNVIFNCWEDSEVGELTTGEMARCVSPMLPAKIKQQVCGLCNIVGRVSSAPNKNGNRQWYFFTEAGKETIMAKDQMFLRKSCLPENLFTAPEAKK
ncbi:AAA family ATPase [Succinimonas sp.]|uniref:AAA family ATPase n=1 Tax=Succinimonas sp. TaxID=1936151 RepID=UPI003866FC01